LNLPIAARELRVAAHNRAVFRGRIWSAALAIFATIWCLYSFMGFNGRINASIGWQILWFQAFAAFAMAVSAMGPTADSISREKRDGTLGLLFLTHLKGRDVVLGKLISNTALWFSSALATMPILALPVLLGGIQISQSINLLLSILNTMLFSASVGLFVSSLSVHRQKAHSAAVGIVFFFCGIIPLFAAMARKLPFSAAQIHFVEMASPFYTHKLALGAPIGIERFYFWWSLGFVFLLSCGLLLAASWLAPRTWQQKVKEPLIDRLRLSFNRKTGQSIKSRSALGRVLLDRNAYEWLAARDKSAATSAWTFTLGWVALAALVLAIYGHRDWEVALITVSLPVTCLLQLGMKIRVGGHACDRFSKDQACGALELILSTPMTVREMVQGEFSALRRHFLVLLILMAALMIGSWRLSSGGIDRMSDLFFPEGGKSPLQMRAFWLTMTFIFFLGLDTLALVWTAMWCALRNLPNPRGTAVSLTLGSPVILFVMIMPILLDTAAFRKMLGGEGFWIIGGIMLSIVVAVDGMLIWRCRKGVLTRAREVASTPFAHTRDLPTMFSNIIGAVLRIRRRRAGPEPARS